MDIPKNVILLTLSFIGVGSLAYLLFFKENEDENVFQTNPNKSSDLEIKIPKNCVGMVIGRQGANIKDIEASSGAKVNFNDTKEDCEYRLCRIRGTTESCQYAEALIHEIIVNQPLIETFTMTIPEDAIARVIGKNGTAIRNISLTSNAKIRISRASDGSGQREVLIEGTTEQISSAKSLINQKVMEEREMRSRMDQSAGQRSPRHQPKYLLAGPTADNNADNSVKEKMLVTSSDGLLEVYVSSIESPDRFFVQVVGPCTVELDKLNDRMTDLYSKPEMREIHALNEIRTGQIVAAPFQYDEKYYRAEVTDQNDDQLNLYYVDYGDRSSCPKNVVYELRTEFLKLRFQAIESILARIKPKDDSWSEEATDLLEELSHVALWKPLTARIHSYRERPTRGAREGSPVPCVDLYDTSGPIEINLAQELVVKGFAVWEESNEAVEEGKEETIAATQHNGDSGCDDDENAQSRPTLP